MSPASIDGVRWQILEIPFKVGFRHASAERVETSSLWIEASSETGTTGYGEGCPRPYVTGETLETARAFVARHEAGLRDAVGDLASLRLWMAAHAGELDANPAAWCGLELACLDLLARLRGQTVEALLSLPPLRGPFRYSAVLGDAEPEVFEVMAERYRQHGFTDFKIKLSGTLERDRQKIDVLRRWPADACRLRVDANNLWDRADEAVAFLRALEYPLFAVEEPLRANQYQDLARVAASLDCRIVLDESLLRVDQLARLPDAPGRWLINVRVSKMGGLLRSLALVEAARAAGLDLIVGAQVGETSLLTRAALTVASAAGGNLVAQEGAFGTWLLERDVCDPPLMFGAAGVLDIARYSWLQMSGFGLVLAPIWTRPPGRPPRRRARR